MKEINLKLTVDEANTVLQALGQLPFAQVYNLVEKIRNQAGQQLEMPQNGAATGADAKKD